MLSQAPDNLKVLYRRALAYEGMGNYSSSFEDIQKILELDPTNQLALKTLERLQKVLPRDAPIQTKDHAPPEETTTNWKLEVAKKEAKKYLENGSVEKAVAVLERALEEGTIDSDQLLSSRQLLAGAYASLEDYQKVLEVSEAILRGNPSNFKALSRAGDAAYRLVCGLLISHLSMLTFPRACLLEPGSMQLGS